MYDLLLKFGPIRELRDLLSLGFKEQLARDLIPILVISPIIFFLYLLLSKRSKNDSMLINLGIFRMVGDRKKPAKWKRIINGVQITNSGYILKNDLENNLEKISSLFSYLLSKKIVFNVLEESFKNKHVFLLKEKKLPSAFILPKAYTSYKAVIGTDFNNKTVSSNLIENFSLFIGGSAGDGKTVTLKAIAYLIMKGFKFDCDLVIIDAKGLDFTDIKSLWNMRTTVTLITIDSSKKILQAKKLLESYFLKKDNSKKVLKEHKIVDYRHAYQKNITIPLRRTLFIFDECGSWLNLKNVVDKEDKENTKALISLVSKMLAQFRSTNCPIILSTQRVHRNEMDVPLDNISSFLLGNISKEMSDKYRGNNFSNHQYGKGIWTFQSKSIVPTAVRTPFFQTFKELEDA